MSCISEVECELPVHRNLLVKVSMYVFMHSHQWLDMWQSRVEIEHYSVAYFNHITVFKVL